MEQLTTFYDKIENPIDNKDKWNKMISLYSSSYDFNDFCDKVTDKNKSNEEKINALGGFSSAIFLGLTAVGIIYESIGRFFNPLNISFIEAIIVAIIGLVVNFICIIIMGGESHFHLHTEEHHTEEKEENLNYKAAYMHIAADAFTSILAITGLLLGKYMGWVVLDPVIGVLGGLIIAKWTFDLIVSSSKILFTKP